MHNIKTYHNLLTQLLKLFRHNRQGSFKTRERHLESMKRFCRFLAEEYRLERLANIAPKHISAYVKHMQARKLAAVTIKTDLAGMRFWHDQIPRARYELPQNSELLLVRRSFGKTDRRWSDAEFNRCIAICWKHDREDYVAIACLGRYAGLRIHECFRIDRATAEHAIIISAITVKGKGGKIRTVPIQESIRIELGKMLTVTPRGHKLFVPEGVPTDMAIERLQRFILTHRSEFQGAGSEAPLTFHGLRHTYAAEQYQKLICEGKTEAEALRQVSKLLGHERAGVTRIYLAGLKGGDTP